MKILLILGFTFYSFYFFSQSKEIKVEELVYEITETQPEFPEGIAKMYEYFSKNINWSIIEFTGEIKTKTYVEFLVDKEGNIKNIKIIKSIHSEIDAEIIRVLTEMPNWTPGTKKGESVDVKYTLPISIDYE